MLCTCLCIHVFLLFAHYQFGAVFPSDVELWNFDYVCMYRSHWSHISQSDFVNCTPSHTVSCFYINYQWTVVPQGTYQMDRDATPAPLLEAESLTPVTQGTEWLQVVLLEHVSQMACGQGVIQLVHVSPHYVYLIYYLYNYYKNVKELLTWNNTAQEKGDMGNGLTTEPWTCDLCSNKCLPLYMEEWKCFSGLKWPHPYVLLYVSVIILVG